MQSYSSLSAVHVRGIHLYLHSKDATTQQVHNKFVWTMWNTLNYFPEISKVNYFHKNRSYATVALLVYRRGYHLDLNKGPLLHSDGIHEGLD